MIQLITTTVFPLCPPLAYFALCCSTFFEIQFNKFHQPQGGPFAKSSNFLVHSRCKQNLAGVTFSCTYESCHILLCVLYIDSGGYVEESIPPSSAEPSQSMGILYLMNPCQTNFFKVWQTLSAKHDKSKNSVYVYILSDFFDICPVTLGDALTSNPGRV